MPASPPSRILVVRLGAMGDILHTLPAAAGLRQLWPQARLAWAVAPVWAPLLSGSGVADEIIPVNRRSFSNLRDAWRALRRSAFDRAYDFQGLIQSALVARASAATAVIGHAEPRERAATLFYTEAPRVTAVHIVDRHRELAGTLSVAPTFPLPPGQDEGDLPPRFVLASPAAGWRAKEWPLERYLELDRLLRRELSLPLVLCGKQAFAGAHSHTCSIAGLIAATRRAAAVVGVDSGPLHLAAALGKPGVALYGPTAPERNGPYSSTFAVLRAPAAATSYKRAAGYDPSMLALSAGQVFEALRERLQ